MKKLFFAIVLAAIAPNITQAQVASIRFANYEKETETDVHRFQVTGLNGAAATINDVNMKAVKDFSKSCKKAGDIHWYIETNGSFVYYYMHGNKGRRFYDKKGSFVYNILSYTEEFLPYAVRDLVKSTYYFDYTITRAEEVQVNGKTFYFIHIEDKSGLKLLRVCDDEMEVIEEMNKK